MMIPQELNQRWSLDFVSDLLACARRFHMRGHHRRLLLGMPGLCRRHLAVGSVGCSRTGRHRRTSRTGIHGGQRNGTELIGHAVLAWCQDTGVATHDIASGKPHQNGFAESFNGRLRVECLNKYLFASLVAARRIVEAWRTDYNTVRPRSSLGAMAPAEFTNSPRQGYMETEAKVSAAGKRGAGQNEPSRLTSVQDLRGVEDRHDTYLRRRLYGAC